MHEQVVYSIKTLSNSKTKRVKAFLLIKCDDSLLRSEVAEELIKLAENIHIRFEVIEKIIELRKAKNELFFQVVWDGPPSERYWTRRQACTFYADVAVLVLNFLKTCQTKKTRQ